MPDERWQELELSQFWHELLASPGGPVAGEGDLEPDLAETIRQLHALTRTPPPAEARARVDRGVLPRFASLQNGKDASQMQFAHTLPLPRSAIGPNGWASPRPHRDSTAGRARARLRWAPVQAATAILVVVTLLFGYVAYRDGRPAGVPTAQETPTAVATPAGDWPMVRGDAQRTGATSDAGPTGQFATLWTFTAPGRLNNPVVAGNGVFVASSEGQLYCLDRATGAQNWVFDTGSPILDTGNAMAYPAVAGDTVYIGAQTGIVYALDIATGAVHWRVDLGSIVESSILSQDGTLYTGTHTGLFVALDAATGAERWRFSSDENYNNTFPAFADGTVFVGGASGAAHAIDAATGVERWRFQTGGVVRATPFADGLIYIPSEDGNLYAVDSATGAERWRVAFGQGTVVLSPVVTGGMVLVSTRGVSALDAETGARLWDVPQTAYDLQTTTGPTTSTASIAGDSVFLYLPDRGGVTSLDLATGEERGFAATQPVRGSPAIAGGVLYVASTDGIAYALAGQGAAPTPAVQSASPTALPVLASTMTPATGGLPATYLWSVDAGAALLAFPPDRTIWAVDVVAGTVTILDRDGVPIGTWGTPGEGPGQFNFKEDEADGWWVDVAFAADGSFWITECGNERVEHFDTSRNLIGSFGIKGSGDGQFLCPAGVVIGENGDLFVADEIRGNIQRFTSDGAFVASFGSFAGPGPLDLDAQGNLIVPDSNGRRVAVLAQDGTEVLEVGQLGGDQGQLSFPVEAIVDDAGNFYVADQYAASLLVFDPHGAFIGSVDMGQAPDGPVTGVYAVGDGGNDSVYVSVGLRDGSVRVQKYKITVPTGPASTSGTPAA